MKNYKCSNCEEVMAIKCTEDIEHCPCCGMSQSLSQTNEPVPSTARTAENWTHKNTDGYDGCGATYSITSDAPVEYCPNCNGQWG